MRHNLSLLFIFSLISTTVLSQFSISVEAGGNFSYWQPKGDGLLKTEGKTGYYIATTPSYKFNDLITTGLNLEYSNRGIVFSGFGSLNGVPVKQNITENYARISPQIHISPFKNLAILLGPEFGFSINEFSKSMGNPSVKSETKFLKEQDLGAVIGTRYFLKNIFLTAKYFHGFSEVSNLNYIDEQGKQINGHQKNRNIQLGIGYRFI